MNDELLRVDDLKVYYQARKGLIGSVDVKALDGVSLEVRVQARRWPSWASPAAARPRWAGPRSGSSGPLEAESSSAERT